MNFASPGFINPERFIRVWQKATSLQEVCKQLEINKAKASNRAALLRKKGVPLKKFTRSHGALQRWDYKALAELAKSLANGGAK